MPRVCVIPCSGIERAEGLVSRQASYWVVERLLCDQTVLGCIPALVAGVQEDIIFVESYPVVSVEGCAELCAMKSVLNIGHPVHLCIQVDRLLEKAGIRLGQSSALRIDNVDAEAVRVVSQAIVDEIGRVFAVVAGSDTPTVTSNNATMSFVPQLAGLDQILEYFLAVMAATDASFAGSTAVREEDGVLQAPLRAAYRVFHDLLRACERLDSSVAVNPVVGLVSDAICSARLAVEALERNSVSAAQDLWEQAILLATVSQQSLGLSQDRLQYIERT